MSFNDTIKKIFSRAKSTANIDNSKNNLKSKCLNNSFVNYLFGKGEYRLSFQTAINLYLEASPLFSAIDLISEEFANIKPVIFDKDTDQFTDQHPILDLLNNPGDGLSYTEFAKAACSYYLITGNVFLIALGRINRQPKEIIIQSPVNATMNSGKDGRLKSIDITNSTFSLSFDREDINKEIRFVNDGIREVWHIRTFNPFSYSYDSSSNNFFGTSKLTPIYLEIEQFISSNRHNLALLKNGATPSGIMNSPGVISDDDFSKLQDELRYFYQGNGNAGNVMLLEGDLSYTPLGLSNKEMDFLSLKLNVEKSIYNVCQVPIPLISSENMTLSNYETAVLRLFDGPVSSFANRFFSEMSRFLVPRFGLNNNIMITYDPNCIDALQIRRLEEIEKKKKLDVLSDNEIRADIGEDPYDGGDVHYKNSNLIAISSGVSTSNPDVDGSQSIDNSETDSSEQSTQLSDNKEKMSYDRFYKLMSNQKDHNGIRKFSDDKIKELSAEHKICQHSS